MRLINADELITAFPCGETVRTECVRATIKHMPTIEERKKGTWIYKDDLKQFFCSECGFPSLTYDDTYIYGMDLPNYCEDCGADMRGEEDGQTD